MFFNIFFLSNLESLAVYSSVENTEDSITKSMLSFTEILTEQPATVTFVSETIDIAGVCLSMGAHRDHLFATLSDMIAWALRIRSH